MRRRDICMEWAAGLCLPLLIVLGWMLSYSALRRLALEHGYATWEATLWPFTVDALALAAMLAAMAIAARHYGPTFEAWGLAVISIAVTVAGNILAAGADPIAEAMHAWPALCMVSAWHLWSRYVSARPRPGRAPDTSPDSPDGVRPALPAGLSVRALPPRRVSLEEYRSAVTELGADATTADIAAGLGVTDRTVRRMRERERRQTRPRVVRSDTEGS